MSAEAAAMPIRRIPRALPALLLGAMAAAAWAAGDGASVADRGADRDRHRADPFDVMPAPPDLRRALPVPLGDGPTADCRRLLATWRQPTEAQPTTLTLRDALGLALCGSPMLLQQSAARDQAAAALGQARAAYWPTVNASLAHVAQRQSAGAPGRADHDAQVTSKSLSIQWRLYDFGQRDSRTNAQARQVDAAAAGAETAALQLTMDVAQQYHAAQAARAAIAARERTAVLAKALLQSALNRHANGLADQADVLQVRSALARTEYELSVARGEADKLRAQLAQTVGLLELPGSRLPLPPADDDDGLRPAPPSDALPQEPQPLLERAVQAHPSLQAARAQLDAARHTVRATERESLPSVDLSWSQYDNGRPDQSVAGAARRERSAALTLRIPLFDGYSQTYRIRAAQADVARREAELEAAEAQVRRELWVAHAEAKSARDNLAAARHLMQAAREAAASMQRKFDRGAADVQQLNPVLTGLAQAGAELAQSWARWEGAWLRWEIQTAGRREAANGD